VEEEEEGVEVEAAPAKRKRSKKKRPPLNAGEIALVELHERVRPFINSALDSLLTKNESAAGFLATQRHLLQSAASIAPPVTANLPDLTEVARDAGSATQEPLSLDDATIMHVDGDPRALANRVVANAGPARLMTLGGRTYVVPEDSAFMWCDITCFSRLSCALPAFDAIVVDPPWENKSVGRSSRYNTLPACRLLSLPVPRLCHANTCVFIWVTNRIKHLDFVMVCSNHSPHTCTWIRHENYAHIHK
jgi:hypothetical protein